MDDITAEVDEREEYSNDFESDSRESCAVGASLSEFNIETTSNINRETEVENMNPEQVTSCTLSQQ